MTDSPRRQDLPKKIKRLDEGVVNRIAAGEVVQRPANAVKELLENSLDAGATTVTITVKDGGIKSLQVQDDGCGIRKDDLDILCERHTTSKLRSFEDLNSINTLGFRGEALASISYVSHLTVTTMTALEETHGWKASYKDGAMNPPTSRPAAATKGTIILAEDLFYNVPLRRKALRSASEEYNAILDVVSRYAVFRAGSAIAVKKLGEAKSDIATPAGGTRLDAIRAVYGAAVARNCLPVELKTNEVNYGEEEKESKNGNGNGEELQCSVSGYITGADYAGRKTQLVVFINGRSVDFPPLKRCLESTFASILPKAAKPFAFFDITMPASDVDVNVHPTKKEVAFLHQEELVEAVRAAVEEALLASNAQRTFKQTLLPGAPVPNALGVIEDGSTLGGGGGGGQPSYYRPDKLVRTDAKVQTLDAFAPSSQWNNERPRSATAANAATVPAEGEEEEDEEAMIEEETDVGAAVGAPIFDGNEGLLAAPRRKKRSAAAAAAAAATMNTTIPACLDAAFLPTAMEIAASALANTQSTPQQTQDVPTMAAPVRHRSNPTQSSGLESVERLLALAESTAHQGVSEVLKTATFVGLADSHRALLQSGTRLYLVDLTTLTRDMFYQQALRRFGQAPRVVLCPAVPAVQLALVALEAEEAAGQWQDGTQSGKKEEIAELLAALIQKKAGLLGDCFSIQVDVERQGALDSLPQLIEQYHPPAEYLPQFVLALGQNVDWQEESECFKGLAEALADLYCLHPDPELDAWTPLLEEKVEKGGDGGAANIERVHRIEREKRRREWEAAHVLLPALRLFLRPPRERARDGTVVELTRLEHLYRVFERC